MSYNSFGYLFRVMSWGESHGESIGCVIDGCPPRIELCIREFIHYMSKRRPGQSDFVSQRLESDEVEIVSGVLPLPSDEDGYKRYITTGTPISLIIKNTDTRSKDYSDIENIYRPSHGDYSYDIKYGIRDAKGGGRASARETAMRVAAGVIARKIIPGVVIRGCVSSIGVHEASTQNWDWSEVERNEFYTPDAKTVDIFRKYINEYKKAGNSIGGVVTLQAENVPKGLGAPIYAKLDQDIAAMLMSINGVKAVEIGAGFKAALMSGFDNADRMTINEKGETEFLSNNAGGIIAGISTGEPIIARFAVKPTSSIQKPLESIDRQGNMCIVTTQGRHDPCIAIRAVAVGEAMLACVLADHYLRHRAQTGC